MKPRQTPIGRSGWETIDVPASRLAWGEWCHDTQKHIGEGDISKSYSGDTIMEGRVRQPFRYRSELFVSVGKAIEAMKGASAEAYRLLLIEDFTERPTTYAEVTRNAEAARESILGFYHGITVQRGRKDYLLCGPPIIFKSSDDETTETQLDLF